MVIYMKSTQGSVLLKRSVAEHERVNTGGGENRRRGGAFSPGGVQRGQKVPKAEGPKAYLFWFVALGNTLHLLTAGKCFIVKMAFTFSYYHEDFMEETSGEVVSEKDHGGAPTIHCPFNNAISLPWRSAVDICKKHASILSWMETAIIVCLISSKGILHYCLTPQQRG